MAKLSKREFKEQEAIFELLKKEKLTEDEKIHIYENINIGFIDNLQAGVYFTPFDMAMDFALMSYRHGKVIDCCAGIGGLSKAMLIRDSYEGNISEIICIEQNPQFVEIGRKLLPEARWICADVFDEELWKELTKDGKADCLISNPPFGKCPSRIKDNYSWMQYTEELELMVLELVIRFSTHGNMILPCGSIEFKENPYYDRVESRKVAKLRTKVKEFFYQESMSIDSTIYSEWKNLGKICTECVEINLDPKEYEPLDESTSNHSCES